MNALAKTIVIFVKAPVPGFAKTRFVPALSPERAAALSRALARDTLKTAAQLPSVSVLVAYRAHSSMPDIDWLVEDNSLGQTDVDWFVQEGHDLGGRLKHAVSRAFSRGPRSVLIIGSDLPSLNPPLLDKAFGLMQSSPVILGPAEDGGYYLLGLREPHISIFEDIEWSQPTVLAQTVAKLQLLRIDYQMLPRRMDLDTPDDLLRLRLDPARLSPAFQETIAVLRTL